MPSGAGQPSNPSEPSRPADAHALSQQLLAGIRDQLGRFEAEVAARDARVADLERELRQVHSALAAERSAAVQARTALEQQAAAQLRTAQQKLAEQAALASAAESRVRQAARAEATLKEKLEIAAAERDRAMAELAEARRHAEPMGHEAATPAATAVVPVSPGASQAREVRRRTPASLPVLAGVAAAIVIVSALITLARDGDRHQLTSVLSVSPPDAFALGELSELAASLSATEGRPFRSVLHPAAGIVELRGEAEDAAEGARAMDRLTGRTVAEFARRYPLSTASAPEEDERVQLLRRARELESASASTRPSGPSAASLAEVADGWRRLREEQGAVSAGLLRTSAASNPEPVDESTLIVESERLRAALAGDAKLRADTEMLGGFEKALRRIVDALLQTGERALSTATPAIAGAMKLVAERPSADFDRETTALLERVRSALADMDKSAGHFQQVLTAQKTVSDVLAIEAAIEPAARAFLSETGGALEALRNSLERMAEGGDQPTKRLVLRNQVTRDVREASEAVEVAAKAAREMLASENIELEAAIRRFAGVQVQVRQQRERIEAGLRGEMAAALRDARAREAASARDEHQRLIAREQELETALQKQADMAFALLDQLAADRGELLAQAARQQEHAEVLARLVAVETARIQRASEQRGPWVAQAIPARAVQLSTPIGRRLGRAILAGLVPVLIAAIIAGGVLAWRAWRRSRAEILEYTRMLEDARTDRVRPAVTRNKA